MEVNCVHLWFAMAGKKCDRGQQFDGVKEQLSRVVSRTVF